MADFSVVADVSNTLLRLLRHELDALVKAAGDDLGAELELHEVDVSDASSARFWMSVEGPLPSQPDVIAVLRKALDAVPGVKVQFVG